MVIYGLNRPAYNLLEDIAWQIQPQAVVLVDTAFNFAPLLMTHGEALIIPPVLTRAGVSMRIEKPDTATTAKTSYELLAPARYVSAAPSWREFMMVDSFPEPEKPNPAVMPKDEKERAIWRSAVREAWARGLADASARSMAGGHGSPDHLG